MSEKGHIDVLDNGPLVAEGLEMLTNSKGEELDTKKKTALCRCGASRNKPYCDGSHKRVGFSSAVEKALPEGCESKDGTRGITVLRNGPYEVHGCVELGINDTGGLSRDEPYYLCRCGASDNKPFCDGSHKEINFTDERN